MELKLGYLPTPALSFRINKVNNSECKDLLSPDTCTRSSMTAHKHMCDSGNENIYVIHGENMDLGATKSKLTVPLDSHTQSP